VIAKVPRRRADGKSSFTTLIAYVAKSAALVVCGDGVLGVATAADEMRFTASSNHRCNDPVYHYILSWPKGEHPSDDQAGDAIRLTLAGLGLLEHQWVGALHRNTGHIHVHVVVNRVHPTTLRVASPRRDWLTLDRSCRVLELRHGWAHDRGPHVVSRTQGEPTICRTQQRSTSEPARESSGARDFAAWTGLDSFQKWVSGEPARALRVAISVSNPTWTDIHRALASFNLEYRLKGSGAIIVGRGGPETLCAKASHVGRFASRSRLEALLGPFSPRCDGPARRIEVSGLRSSPEGPRASYSQPTARTSLEKTLRGYRIDPLFERYQADCTIWRSCGLPRYRALWQAQRQRERSRLEAFRQANADIRSMIQVAVPARIRPTLGLYQAWFMALARERNRILTSSERQTLRNEQHREQPSAWDVWLERQAEKGDQRASQRLRRRRLCERRHVRPMGAPAAGSIWADAAPRLTQFEGFRAVASAAGLDYCRSQLALFRDTGNTVVVFDPGAASIGGSLLLAREKWGSKLQISGESTFLRRAEAIAKVMRVELEVVGDRLDSHRNFAIAFPESVSVGTRLPGVVLAHVQELSLRLGRPLSVMEPTSGLSVTGKVVAVLQSGAQEGIVVADLGRRLGVFEVLGRDLQHVHESDVVRLKQSLLSIWSCERADVQHNLGPEL